MPRLDLGVGATESSAELIRQDFLESCRIGKSRLRLIEALQVHITGFLDEEKREHRDDTIKRVAGRHVAPLVKNVLADEAR